MYTFLVIRYGQSEPNYFADIRLDNPEHIAERLDYWDKQLPPAIDEENCLVLVVEE